MLDARSRADRRVLPHPNAAADVADALADRFGGDAELHLPAHELRTEDIIDTLLVPSNQGEYLSEIEDRALRQQVIRELMLDTVIPEMQRQPAGTAEGLNVQ